MAQRRSSPTAVIDIVADSWCRRHRPESMNTDWGQSLLAYGLLAATRTTGNDAAREHLRRWLVYHLGAGIQVTYFVGSWSPGLLYPEALGSFPDLAHALRPAAERIYEFILHKSLRNGDGVILHNVDLPHIYIDTLYYSAPVLAKIGAALGRSDWRTEAMRQFRSHLDILRDPESQLWIHCQENLSGRRSEGAWGRGNGWVAMTCAELLPYLKRDSADWNEVRATLVEIIERLLPLQTRSGLWRTIVDDRRAYEETSATAMFLFALLRGRALGVLPVSAEDAIARAARGLARHVDAEGRLLGCSEGTWPGTREYYRSLGRGEWWWGTGAYLISLRELALRESPIA